MCGYKVTRVLEENTEGITRAYFRLGVVVREGFPGEVTKG